MAEEQKTSQNEAAKEKPVTANSCVHDVHQRKHVPLSEQKTAPSPQRGNEKKVA